MSEPWPRHTGDPDGRPVLLTETAWAHIVRDDGHPDLQPFQQLVLDVVRKPDHRGPDAIVGRERFWGRGVGPSRWLRVVVDFTKEPAVIVTAFSERRDPQDWKQ